MTMGLFTAFMSNVVHITQEVKMVKFTSKSELDSKKSDNKKIHNVGTIYPQIFSSDKDFEFKAGMQMEAGVIWLGAYMIDSDLFPKEKCPICGKEEIMIPYKAVGSVLSGSHTIQFWCENCGEKFVTNDYIEYFRLIYKYILQHKNEFPPEQEIPGCSKVI